MINDKSRLCNYNVSEDKLDCYEFKDVPNGFYWNSYNYKYIIACDGTLCDDIYINDNCIESSVGNVFDNNYNIGFCIEPSNSIPMIPGSEIKFKYTYTPDNAGFFSKILGNYVLKTDYITIKTDNYSSVISKYILFNIKLKTELKKQ